MPATDHEKSQGERQHIFAVNHDPPFLDLVRELLQDEHYNVTTTNYVPKTWDQIAALAPSLLLIDVSPADTAGWELLERLHREGVTNTIPIVVTSTDPRLLERVRQDIERLGSPHIVAKPMGINELLGAIQELIGPA